MIVIAIESAFLSANRTGSIVIPILHWMLPGFDYEQLARIHEVGRKVGHFIGYGLMSYFLFRAFRGTHLVHEGTEDVLLHKIVPAGHRLLDYFWQWKWAVFAILGTALVATADEVHQMYDPTRTGRWADVLLDTLGAIAFQLLVMTVIRVRTGQKPGVPEVVRS